MAVAPPSTSDRAAFEQLYRLHARSVYGFVRSRIGNPDDAEDVTQATFLNAYRSCLRGRYPQHPESWLIAIARNECRQRFRQQQRRLPTERLDERSALVQAPSAEWTADDIQRALNALPEVARRALVMRELEGRSYVEIGAALGLSDSALQALLFRTRRQLREQFEETLSCAEARRSLDLRSKGELGIAGRRALRTHLRSCPACAERAQRPSGRERRRELTLQLLLLTLPVRRVLRLVGLTSGSSGAGTGAGGAVAAKAATVLVAGALAGGVGYTVVEQPGGHARVLPRHASGHRAVRPAGHASAGRARSTTRWAPRAVRWVGAPAAPAVPAKPTSREVDTHPANADAPATPPPVAAPLGDDAPPTDSAPQPDPAASPTGTATPDAPAPDPQPDAAANAPQSPEGADVPSDPVLTSTSSPVPSEEGAGDHPVGRGKGHTDSPPAATPPGRRTSGVVAPGADVKLPDADASSS